MQQNFMESGLVKTPKSKPPLRIKKPTRKKSVPALYHVTALQVENCCSVAKIHYGLPKEDGNFMFVNVSYTHNTSPIVFVKIYSAFGLPCISYKRVSPLISIYFSLLINGSLVSN